MSRIEVDATTYKRLLYEATAVYMQRRSFSILRAHQQGQADVDACFTCRDDALSLEHQKDSLDERSSDWTR